MPLGIDTDAIFTKSDRLTSLHQHLGLNTDYAGLFLRLYRINSTYGISDPQSSLRFLLDFIQVVNACTIPQSCRVCFNQATVES